MTRCAGHFPVGSRIYYFTDRRTQVISLNLEEIEEEGERNGTRAGTDYLSSNWGLKSLDSPAALYTNGTETVGVAFLFLDLVPNKASGERESLFGLKVQGTILHLYHKERAMKTVTWACRLLCLLSGIPTHRIGPPTLRLGLLTQSPNQKKKTQRHAHGSPPRWSQIPPSCQSRLTNHTKQTHTPEHRSKMRLGERSMRGLERHNQLQVNMDGNATRQCYFVC